MMTDKDFCVEFVNRLYQIDSKKNLKTKCDLFEIVLEKKPIPIIRMFNDEAILELFGGLHKQPSISSWVYSFVRDNQELFISENDNSV